MAGGRPTDYTPELGDYLCGEVAGGTSVKQICERDDMPSRQTFFRWLRVHQEFRDNYTDALKARAHLHAEEIVNIADGETEEAAVDRDRLRVDARKWTASRLLPKTYGDVTTLKGDAESPVVALWKIAEPPKG